MSKIEWTDRTWNPVRGCTRVSEGCRNCYAERQAARDLPGMRSPTTGKPFAIFRRSTGAQWTGEVELIESRLTEPSRWKKPQRIFVNSMSDLFHEKLPQEAIDRVMAMMAVYREHTFQVLTKRAQRMREYMAEGRGREARRRVQDVLDPTGGDPTGLAMRLFKGWPLPNVWLGVSVEDQETADERIPLLLQTPAVVRFVSYEPALGPVNFRPWLPCEEIGGVEFERWIDWLIVGGESGPGARPFDVRWAESVIDQCKAAGVACFVKQLGSQPIDMLGKMRGAMIRKNDTKGSAWREWPPHLQVRQFPTLSGRKRTTAQGSAGLTPQQGGL